MSDFQLIKDLALRKSNDFRNILTLLQRPDFEELYEKSTDKERVFKLVEAGAHEPLRAWYRSKLTNDLGDKSVRELRELAAALLIPDYTRLKKSLLLSEIVKRQNPCVKT